MNLKTSNVKTKSETQFHVRYSLFSGKAFKFEHFLPHLDSERKEKKRVGHHFADT
jgi:hypothetical protein